MYKSKSTRLLALLLLVGGALYFFAGRPYPIVNSPPSAGPIVAFGDSLTSGYGAAAGSAYPDHLARLIGKPVINAGVAGNTVADAARRLVPDVLRHKPGIVIVLLGGNDLLRRQNLDTAFAELERLVRRIQGSGAMVVLVGLKVMTPIGGIASRYSALARRTGCVFVPDILHEIFFNRSLMSDQTHPNGSGYAIVAERVAKALRPYL